MPLLVVQIALLPALVPPVYATPPDPLWIPGIYDEAEQDDDIRIITDEGLAVANILGAGGKPFATKPRSLNQPALPLIASAVSTPRLRSPPSC